MTDLDLGVLFGAGIEPQLAIARLSFSPELLFLPQFLLQLQVGGLQLAIAFLLS